MVVIYRPTESNVHTAAPSRCAWCLDKGTVDRDGVERTGRVSCRTCARIYEAGYQAGCLRILDRWGETWSRDNAAF